jgi:hypothetical protein
MPVEIEAFLTAHRPNFICVRCLASMTEREEYDVRNAVMTCWPSAVSRRRSPSA